MPARSIRTPALLGSSGSLTGCPPLSGLLAAFGASVRFDGLVEHIFPVEVPGLPRFDRIAECLDRLKGVFTADV
jgi:hypothetical protein